jgi:hypothetical protein
MVFAGSWPGLINKELNKNEKMRTKHVMNQDNGYISDYLVHWTGKKGDEAGAVILSLIASTCHLLLSYNKLHIIDMYHEIHEKMVCFTDVPLSHAAQHCNRYGRFGIAFHKLSLMNVGVQPVFYATHANDSDLHVIFKFLQEQVLNTTIDTKLFKALHRHFYFTQAFSEGKADEKDTFYYEREWRLGAQNLAPAEMFKRPDNPHYYIQQAGYSRHHGKLIVDGEKEYFEFNKEHVAFLIRPT